MGWLDTATTWMMAIGALGIGGAVVLWLFRSLGKRQDQQTDAKQEHEGRDSQGRPD